MATPASAGSDQTHHSLLVDIGFDSPINELVVVDSAEKAARDNILFLNTLIRAYV